MNMKNLLLLIAILFFSLNIVSQSIQEFIPSSAYENHSFFVKIYGYKTHFEDSDSNYFCFYNDKDTIDFWMSLSVGNYSNEHFKYHPGLQYPAAGLYNLKVYNSIDDTMYFKSAIQIFKGSGPNMYDKFSNYYPEEEQAGMQGDVTMKSSYLPNFLTATNHSCYFVNRNNDTIRVDSINILTPYEFIAYFDVPSHSIGLYHCFYTNSIDSLIIGYNSFLVKNNSMTQIEEVTPDSINNLQFGPKLITIKGNNTHFTNDTNSIQFNESNLHRNIDSVTVVNDTTITFILDLPMPWSKAAYTTNLLRVYNETDGMMYYPFRVDIYGSIEENKKNFDNISIYPNPSSDIIHIQSEDFKGENQLSIQVLSIDGKVLLAEQNKANGNTQINIADLPSGIYILRIEDKNRVGVYRVVKH